MNNINDVIKELINLLEKEKKAEFVSDCLKIIKNEEVYFHSGTKLTAEHAFKTYESRNAIQKEVTLASVLGYDSLLKALSQNCEQGNRNVIVHMIIQDLVYIIFTDENITRLFGLLVSKHSNLDSYEKILIHNKSKGIESNAVKLFRIEVIG